MMKNQTTTTIRPKKGYATIYATSGKRHIIFENQAIMMPTEKIKGVDYTNLPPLYNEREYQDYREWREENQATLLHFFSLRDKCAAYLAKIYAENPVNNGFRDLRDRTIFSLMQELFPEELEHIREDHARTKDIGSKNPVFIHD